MLLVQVESEQETMMVNVRLESGESLIKLVSIQLMSMERLHSDQHEESGGRQQ